MLSIKYPIYIISKGRYKNPITAKYFLNQKINFKIVIEPQEYELYKENIPDENIIQLPFSNLGLGSYPARNFCWEDSIKNGFQRHWIFDDNIYGFYKFDKKRIRLNNSKEAFNIAETFTDRYKNIAISGFNYRKFCIEQSILKPFYLNCHVYSAMLINNKIPFRWRLKYNEDIDLCLQALHNRWCTVLFNIYSVKKVSTVAKMKGGNQDELYKNNNPKKKYLKSKSLELIWPNYVKTIYRFDRPHHYINWKQYFKHGLIRSNK